MSDKYKEFLKSEFNIDEKVYDLVQETEKSLSTIFSEINEKASINQLKILKAFQDNHINSTHFDWSSGYGYDDNGREAVERVYASVFKTEAALVRPNIVNGTHAIAITLLGLLKPGDELIEASGTPYDTLQTVIGTSKTNSSFNGSILDYGINYKEVPLNKELDLDFNGIKNAITNKTKVIAFQRSTGYDFRPAISLASIEKACKIIHNINPKIIVMIDNCYGEFVDLIEPTEIGVDVMAGSLIKNPGGGIALSGGYIVGKKDLINSISYRLTCPGIGSECGLTYGQNRHVLQGLFLSPRAVNSALKGAILTGEVYKKLGFETIPNKPINRSDIIQAIKFENPESTIEFCNAIQSASPIDSYALPTPWDMPGYEDKVIMASGAFVQGSSIELSADAPLREPYVAYFQGGLSYEHSKYGVIKALDVLYKKGMVTL